MTPEAQRIAIAETCGFSNIHVSEFDKRLIGDDKEGNGCLSIPDYLSDLNAMHKAEKVLNDQEQARYIKALENNVPRPFRGSWSWALLHATAAQRAEAFLRTLGLWMI